MNTVVQILEAVGDRADAHLLERFVRARNPDAFASLVRRHGPMVLGNAADAADALE